MVAAAIEDTGIRFSARALNFTHNHRWRSRCRAHQSGRRLVVHWLLIRAGLIERNNLPTNLRNGTGIKLKTDGRVAVLRNNEFEEPRIIPGLGLFERTNILRVLGASLRTELIRSNFIDRMQCTAPDLGNPQITRGWSRAR